MLPSIRPRPAVFAVALMIALVAPGARAQSLDLEGLLRQGVALRQQGRDADALEAFQQAWGVAQEPRVEAQIALAEQALGRWVDAAAHLEASLADPHDPWIARNRDALTESLAEIQRHVGRLRVTGGVPGAVVSIDGTRVGTLPMDEPPRVVAGTAVLTVHAPGYYDVSRQVDVPAGGEAREAVDLVPVPVALPVAMAQHPVLQVHRHGGSVVRTLAWASLLGTGLALAAAGTGIAFRENAVNQYNTDPGCPGTGSLAQPVGCQSRVNLAGSMRALEIGSFVGAGVLAVTAITLFEVAGHASTSAGTDATHTARGLEACGPTLGAAGIACGGRF